MNFNTLKSILSQIISIHPPVMETVDSFNPPGAKNKELSPKFALNSQNNFLIDKIRFDNAFRASVSTITFLICGIMSWGGFIFVLKPILIIYLIYGIVHVSLILNATRFKNARTLDFILCSMDIIALSIAVYFTGGKQSPLYFVYFIPLVIHSYHRDWSIIILYGFGGVILYSAAVLFSIPTFSGMVLLDFAARVALMLLTVGIATLAVNLLRKRDDADQTRLSYMFLLTRITYFLNTTASSTDLKSVLTDILADLNQELDTQVNGWAQITMAEQKKSSAETGNEPLINIPISGTENQNYGTLSMGRSDGETISNELKKVLNFIARSLGLTIERLKKSEEMGKWVEMDSCTTAAFVKSSRDVEQTYESVLEGIISILKIDQASLMLWEKPIGKLVTRKVVGPHNSLEKDFTFRMGESIPGRVLEEGSPIWTTDIDNDPKFRGSEIPFKSLLSIPLFNLQAEPIGVINAWSKELERSFSPFEMDLAATFVTRAAVAIENARLHLKNQNDIHQKAA